MLCFGELEIYFVFLCCFDPITGRHKEDDFQKENGILFWVYIWMFAWYLSLLSIPIARLSFIWTCEIWGDQVKCSSRRTPRYFTELVGNNLFPSSLILKELFNFVFCLWNTTSSIFSIFRESLFALSHIESCLSYVGIICKVICLGVF